MPIVTVSCHASYAFDIGGAIDLASAERRLEASSRRAARSRRRAPQTFHYRPAPLRVGQEPPNAEVAGLRVARVEVTLFDFGAASVTYTLPFGGELQHLVAISAALQDNPVLGQDARSRVATLVGTLGDAVNRPVLADLIEDYVLFEIEPQSELEPGALATTHGHVVAQILRSETQPLSGEEMADALSHRIAFGTGDITLIDWNTALLYDPEPDETRTLIEFANVQLLELRHLDAELDRILDRAYAAVVETDRGLLKNLRPPASALRALGALQIDAATLHERITNALKLVGDQFLSRLYDLIASRFHVADWDRAITRKLEVLDGVYQKLADRVSARRVEVLEWIVIVLIAVEVIVGLR